MFDFSQLTDFHFIRPLWFLALIPSILIYILLLNQHGTKRKWQKFISPHLLEHLLVGSQRKGIFKPVHLLFLICIIAIISISGPTWEKEASPFIEDQASLVICLDLSDSMNAIDIQPTRLERAKQKVKDLLSLRQGAKTCLIAYAGSAHMVLPFTDDPQILITYLDSLSPKIMPLKGKDATKALTLAQKLLDEEEIPGSIFFITDGINENHLNSVLLTPEDFYPILIHTGDYPRTEKLLSAITSRSRE